MPLISIYHLRSDLIQDFIISPETGMGYHVAKVDQYSILQKSKEIIISNCSIIFDFENFNNLPLLLDLDEFEIRDSRFFSFEKLTSMSNSRYESINTDANNFSYPPYTYFSEPNEKFIRLSAYRYDKRITENGGVIAGTYATTRNDMKVTPSGLAAVGRYALPNRQPAIYVFEISPPENTPIYFGTVTPNYGMCGGGVEVFFPTNLPAGCAKFINEIAIK